MQVGKYNSVCFAFAKSILGVGKVYLAVCSLFLFKYSLNSAKVIFSVSFAQKFFVMSDCLAFANV